MKPEITQFVRKICEKYGLRAIFIPDVRGDNDLYSITTPQGVAIMNFTTEIFYHVPPRARERMFLPSIKRGLNHLLGERQIQKSGQLNQHRRMGKVIV